ncbi:hypothetical protein B0T25DRAFT_131252 [Lasiosphaeria hispida]|uniref:Cytochrome b561 domain-containing protein n=1 Tax=Lasiosphaeria hispida TaxID=260671 RepID=A0AAJ0HSF0_9PEZI|nr:hypothetical protein B0T25DRAFT_131252 [Lasiosphaeria hispida]
MAKLHVLVALAGLLSVISPTQAEQAQYCNFQSGKEGIPPAPNDFCVAASTHRNHTRNAHDVYMTLDVYRPQSDARGWSAIGIGEGMAQALTFVVYGDPKSPSGPVVSIRRASGREEPRPYYYHDAKANNMAGIHVQVLSSEWAPSHYPPRHNIVVAHISLVCYACDTGRLDPGLDPLISTAPGRQPQAWIWAKNTQQQSLGGTTSQQATLDYHSEADRGFFFVDMARTIATGDPGSKTIRPGVSTVGAAETKEGLARLLSQEEEGRSSRRAFAHVVKTALHGFFMALAFLLLLPAGVLASLFSSGSSRHTDAGISAFRLHWMVQAAAMACILVGLVLGLLLQPRLSAAHHLVGVATISAIGVQVSLGMAHYHTQLMRAHHARGSARAPQKRWTWMARVHISLGRVVLLAGYASVLTGMVLRGASVFRLAVTGAIAVAEVLWLAVMVVRKRKELAAWEKEGEKSADVDSYRLLKEEEE